MLKNPLRVSELRLEKFSGSNVSLEKNLEDGEGYTKQIISYYSDGLKIFGLLTIPKGDGKFPLVVFNRGFIDPKDYQTDRQYLRYLDHFAQSGFVVFKSDYRGIGNSEGESESVTSSANATDVLNGLASLKSNPSIDFEKCFIWGHSMGAMVTLHCLLVPSANIASQPNWLAGSLWAGFIIPYHQILSRWLASNDKQRQRAEEMLKNFGDPNIDPTPWQEISPFYFLDQLPCPIQLHHGTLDTSIPQSDSIQFHEQLSRANKEAGIYLYPNGDHNLSGPELAVAMDRTVEFFKSKL